MKHPAHLLALLFTACCALSPAVTMQGDWKRTWPVPPIEGHPHPGPNGELRT
jgi:hypothetical protein